HSYVSPGLPCAASTTSGPVSQLDVIHERSDSGELRSRLPKTLSVSPVRGTGPGVGLRTTTVNATSPPGSSTNVGGAVLDTTSEGSYLLVNVQVTSSPFATGTPSVTTVPSPWRMIVSRWSRQTYELAYSTAAAGFSKTSST